MSSGINESSAVINGQALREWHDCPPFDRTGSTIVFGRNAENYPTRRSLEPVRKLIAECAALADERFRSRWRIGLPPKVAGVAGGVVGAGLGNALLAVGAASGAHGAAALTSGLAFAGAVVGGGMAAGIAVVSAPVAIVGVTAYAYARRREHLKLLEEKRELLKEALVRREALSRSGGEWGRGNGNLHAHLIGLKARLDECIAHLRQDLGQSG